MSFEYKWIDGGVQRKARCALRGDLMIKGVNYDPRVTYCPTADMSSERILLAMEVRNEWTIENMEIVNEYVHEDAMYEKPVFVKEKEKEKGQYVNRGTIGVLRKTLWGGKSTGYYYISGLMDHMQKGD